MYNIIYLLWISYICPWERDMISRNGDRREQFIFVSEATIYLFVLYF